MNNDPSALGTYLKGPVRLRFADGEVVEATLLGADVVRNRDRTYEVTQLLHPAEPAARGTGIGATVFAQLEDLVGWEALD